MALVWEYAPASGNELLLLLAIADQANDLGADAWPSIDTLARRTRLNPRTVQRLLQRLAASRLLAIEPGGGRRSNRYAIDLSLLTDSPAAPPTKGHPRQGVTPDVAATSGATQSDHPRDGTATPPTPSSTSLSPPSDRHDASATPPTLDANTTNAAKEIVQLIQNFAPMPEKSRLRLEGAVLDALRAGHGKGQLYELLSRSLNGARSPIAVIHSRIRGLTERTGPDSRTPARPEWCGNCDGPEPHRRWIELNDGRVQACPNCHPKHTKSADLGHA